MVAATVATHIPVEEAKHQHKWLIAVAVMLGTTLEVLDSSIVNVSLPHMQGTFSASVDEIAWVLTSYLAQYHCGRAIQISVFGPSPTAS
jgi:MFS family permease